LGEARYTIEQRNGFDEQTFGAVEQVGGAGWND
jgi:hypothetical protein